MKEVDVKDNVLVCREYLQILTTDKSMIMEVLCGRYKDGKCIVTGLPCNAEWYAPLDKGEPES